MYKSILKDIKKLIESLDKKQKTAILLFLIFAIGLFLRIWNINSIPSGIYTDEAMNGLDALNAMHGNWEWFYVANNGREGLFMNLIALCFEFFSVSTLSLKIPSIIFGALAILGTYLLATEIFKGKRIAIIGAFLMAVSFWAINFSRISFRAIMLPTVLVFAFYFFWRGIWSKKWYNFAIGGVIFGLGMHTYIAFRIAPAILIITLAFLVATQKRFLRDYWCFLFIFVFFFFVSAAPMLYIFFITNPEYLISRSAEISILSPAVNQGHFFSTLFTTSCLALTKYVFWGDQNWRHNFPPYGLLDPLSGIAFVFGLIYSLMKTTKFFFIKNVKKINSQKIVAYVFLISWFLIMLIPEIMAVEKNPHALRSIGTMPVVFIFAALALDYLWRKIENKNYIHKKIAFQLLFSIFIFIGLFNPIKYFFFWAKNPQTARAFNQELVEIENYIQTLPREKEIFVFTDNERRKTLRFFNFQKANIYDFNPIETEIIHPRNTSDFEIIYTDYKRKNLEKNMKALFPALKSEKRTDSAGISFFILK